MTNRDWYIERIVEMLSEIADERFLNQIRTIIKKHLQKKRGAV